MGPGGIATIIAASSLAVIAVSIAYAVVRLSRVIDQARDSLKEVTAQTTPLLEEVTETVSLVNGPLRSVNKITKSAEELTTKISDATGSFLDKNAVAMKVAGAILGAAKTRKASKSRNSPSDRKSKS